jgi:hypothetical protein
MYVISGLDRDSMTTRIIRILFGLQRPTGRVRARSVLRIGFWRFRRVSRLIKQVHARKNPLYFLVFQKTKSAVNGEPNRFHRKRFLLR